MSEKHTGFIKVKSLLRDDDEVIDIPTMHKMPIEQYKDYLSHLMWVDHHDVLRSDIGGFPIAVTQNQLHALIEHLQSLKLKDA